MALRDRSAAALLLAHSRPLRGGQAEKQQPSAKLAKPLQGGPGRPQGEEVCRGASPSSRRRTRCRARRRYDQHVINDLLAFAYTNTQNYAEAAKAIEAELDDGFTPESEKPQKLRALAEMNYQLKNYDKAIDFGNRAIKGGCADERAADARRPGVLPQGRLQGHAASSRRRLADEPDQGGRDAEEGHAAAGLQLLPEAQRRRLPDARHGEAGRLLPAAGLLESAAVQRCASRPRATTPTLLQTYRLMSEVDVLKTPGRLHRDGAARARSRFPGRGAATCCEKGIAEGRVHRQARQGPQPARCSRPPRRRPPPTRRALPRLEKEADAAPTGAKNVGVGLAYLGYGQYDKAVDAALARASARVA